MIVRTAAMTAVDEFDIIDVALAKLENLDYLLRFSVTPRNCVANF